MNRNHQQKIEYVTALEPRLNCANVGFHVANPPDALPDAV